MNLNKAATVRAADEPDEIVQLNQLGEHLMRSGGLQSSPGAAGTGGLPGRKRRRRAVSPMRVSESEDVRVSFRTEPRLSRHPRRWASADRRKHLPLERGLAWPLGGKYSACVNCRVGTVARRDPRELTVDEGFQWHLPCSQWGLRSVKGRQVAKNHAALRDKS